MPVLREPTREEYTTLDPQAFWSTFVLPRLIRIEGISSRDETGVIMRARQTLDDELAAMHLVMCFLRTRRNALSAVSALPAEVLARIFEFYAALQPPASDDERPLGWIELTHVCRLWRDTAMQFPSLWSDICFDLGPQWAEAMLARTKEAPVSLRRRLAWAPNRSMNIISEHMRHTRELSLVGPLDVLERYIRTLPSPPRTLEIMELGTDYSDFLITRVVNFKLPEAKAGGMSFAFASSPGS
ncbi:hypothetical protein EWM64_g236 [Hericium alpestre]|uniref:F-box domain-containing protein n=1 Tax=Hericium alpestre TaxID=135208 RepID=A0A4Z0ABN3_9AGAM|nr:hypothetical protein EWM64_g236 [Hericium alpestre]